LTGQVPDALSIAEIAALAGVTPRTVRYYVAEGLLPPPEGAGQQRVYTSEHLLRLQAIKALKATYLPLGEIRRRLAGTSAADLKQLAEATAPTPPSSALAYLASIQPGLGPRIREASPAYQRDRFPPLGSTRPSASLAPVDQGGPSGPGALPRPGQVDAGPGETVWRRVTLAPGVELHYQPSGDRRRDSIVAHIIRTASHLLESLSHETST
jgi:DNA-binding transcriptional MerR regulator